MVVSEPLTNDGETPYHDREIITVATAYHDVL